MQQEKLKLLSELEQRQLQEALEDSSEQEELEAEEKEYSSGDENSFNNDTKQEISDSQEEDTGQKTFEESSLSQTVEKVESTEPGPSNAVQDSPEVAQENDIGSLQTEEKLNGKIPIAEPLKQNGN